MYIDLITYEDLIDESLETGFPSSLLKKYYELLHVKASKFYDFMISDYKETYGIDITQYIHAANDDLLHRTFLDSMDDLRRLKEFHKVKLPNNFKLGAYMAYWIIQRQPFQLKNDPTQINISGITDDAMASIISKLMFFNEFFAVTFVKSTIFNIKSKSCAHFENHEKYTAEWNKAEDYLHYYFIYRARNAKGIEAFLRGCSLHPIWELSKDIT